jgi:hypothetical protein
VSNKVIHVAFEILTALPTNNYICWDILFLLELLFNPEDGSNMHLRNVG